MAGGVRRVTPSASRIALNQATCETTALGPFLDACRSAGLTSVGLWRHHVRDTAAARRACDDAGMAVSSLCRGGFFTGPDRAAAERDNLRAVEEAAELGAVLVLVCGPAVDGDLRGARARIAAGVERLLPRAADAGVVLAIEPFHPLFAAERSALVTLAQANDLLDALPDPHLGVAVDAYHVWWDPALERELDRAAGRIAGVHVADWLVPTTSVLRGRGLPGDGVIDLAGFLRAVEATGYAGLYEVEVLNEAVWRRPADEVAATVAERMASLLHRGGGLR